jgi:hypothetical protein
MLIRYDPIRLANVTGVSLAIVPFSNSHMMAEFGGGFVTAKIRV